MQRLNFTLDEGAVELLERLAAGYYDGNRSQTVRAALESLAAHAGQEGWVVRGYAPVVLKEQSSCHTCGDEHNSGDILFRPVFERGDGPNALPAIPLDDWLDCPDCAEQNRPPDDPGASGRG